MFTIPQHGDGEEQAAWPLFLAAEFPQYEEFWRLFIVELTNRVHDVGDITFRPQKELDAAGRSEWHVEVAQLHYTTLLHLVRVFRLRKGRVRDRDSFLEAIVRLDAATDTAFELLGHCLIDRGDSEGWDEMAGKKVRNAWGGEDNGHPFTLLHRYRNSILHGRVRPEIDATIPGEGWETRVPSTQRSRRCLTRLIGAKRASKMRRLPIISSARRGSSSSSTCAQRGTHDCSLGRARRLQPRMFLVRSNPSP